MRQLRAWVTDKGPEWWGWTIGVVVFGTLWYSVISLTKLAMFTTGLDLGIFNEAISALAHGRAPVSTIKGFTLFGDHFHPIIVLAVPFYWIWDGPATLLVLQSFALGLTGGIVTRGFGRLIGWNGVLLGYVLVASAAVQQAGRFEFHEVAFGAPILALAGVYFANKRYVATMVAALAFLLVKEDAFLVSVGLGLALAWRRRWREAGITIGVSLGWTWLVVKVIIPALNPDGVWSYSEQLGLTDLVATSLRTLVRSLIWPGTATLTALLMLAGVAFVGLRSPLIFSAAVPYLFRASVDNDKYWVLDFHYQLLTMVAIVIAAGDQLGRRAAPRFFREIVIALAAASMVVFPAWKTFSRLDPTFAGQAAEAVAQVPDGARVAAAEALVARLSENTRVSAIRPENPLDGIGPRFDEVTYQLYDVRTPTWNGPQWSIDMMNEQLAAGFEQVWTNDRFVLLRRA